MRVLYFLILIIFSNYSFALQPGQCSFSGTTLTYTGSDITVGPLTGGSEKLLGYLDLSMPYSCYTYTTATDGYSSQAMAKLFNFQGLQDSQARGSC